MGLPAGLVDIGQRLELLVVSIMGEEGLAWRQKEATCLALRSSLSKAELVLTQGRADNSCHEMLRQVRYTCIITFACSKHTAL